MKPLDHYATLHHTDKRSELHDFANFYESKIGHLRDKPIKILELGTKHGESLRMWEDAFPSADVYGIDIAPEWKVTLDRAHFTKLDLEDRQALEAYCKEHGPWDVVIDDSDHTEKTTRTAVETIWPNEIVPGGWLFIEDINSGFKTLANGKVKRRMGQLNYCRSLIENVCHSGKLHYCGPSYWGKSSEFDKAIKEMVFAPGIMGMLRR